jgi:hypothetical protein
MCESACATASDIRKSGPDMDHRDYALCSVHCTLVGTKAAQESMFDVSTCADCNQNWAKAQCIDPLLFNPN